MSWMSHSPRSEETQTAFQSLGVLISWSLLRHLINEGNSSSSASEDRSIKAAMLKINSPVGKNPEHNSEVITVQLCGEH